MDVLDAKLGTIREPVSIFTADHCCFNNTLFFYKQFDDVTLLPESIFVLFFMLINLIITKHHFKSNTFPKTNKAIPQPFQYSIKNLLGCVKLKKHVDFQKSVETTTKLHSARICFSMTCCKFSIHATRDDSTPALSLCLFTYPP